MFQWLIVLVHAAALLFLSWDPTFNQSEHDEAIYLGAGSVIWHTGEVANKMTEAHPPLTYYLNSLFLGPNPIDWEKKTDWFEMAKKIESARDKEFALHNLESIGRDIVEQTMQAGKSVPAKLFLARLPYVLLSLFFLLYLAWSLKAVEGWMGLVFVALYGLSPVVLFLTPGVMTDVPMVVFTMAALFCFSRYIKSNTRKTLLWAGLWQGLALGCKVSAIVLVPCGVLAIIWKNGRHFKKTFIENISVILITFLTLWGLYGFQINSLEKVEKLHHIFPVHEMNGEPTPKTRLETQYGYLYEANLPMVSIVMPLRLVFHRRAELVERTAVEGPLQDLVNTSWYPWTVVVTYFPLSFCVLLMFTLIQGVRKKVKLFDLEWMPFISFTLLYGVVTFSSQYLYGMRHVFPLYPSALVWMAFSLQTMELPQKKRYKPILMILLLVTTVEMILFLATGRPWSLWMYLC